MRVTALTEWWIRTKGYSYLEFRLVSGSQGLSCGTFGIYLGMTALAKADLSSYNLGKHPESVAFHCGDCTMTPSPVSSSSSWPGLPQPKHCSVGDRIGLLVQHSCLYLYRNGQPLGVGPAATSLKPRMRYFAQVNSGGQQVEIVERSFASMIAPGL